MRPSERMFRRSRAAEDRRIRSMNKDARFFRVVFGIASVGTFIVFLIIVFMSKAYAQVTPAQNAATPTPEPQTTALTRPILGDFTAVDIMGVAFVIVAGYAVYRKYKR